MVITNSLTNGILTYLCLNEKYVQLLYKENNASDILNIITMKMNNIYRSQTTLPENTISKSNITIPNIFLIPNRDPENFNEIVNNKDYCKQVYDTMTLRIKYIQDTTKYTWATSGISIQNHGVPLDPRAKNPQNRL